MTSIHAEDQKTGSRAVWRQIADGAGAGPLHDDGERAKDRLVARRLGQRITAATINALTPDLVAETADVRGTRLLNRMRHQLGRQWLDTLIQGGVEALPIKGLATGPWLYARAEDRGLSDADILVRPGQLNTALEILQGHGFAFARRPTRNPWGFVSDASFQPLLSEDRASNIDLHIAGDAAPFPRMLDVDAIMAGAVARDGMTVPSPAHCFLIAASHAARDLFTGDAAKTVVDGLMMLRAGADGAPRLNDADWSEIAGRARKGRMIRPVATFTALLGALGGKVDTARRHLPVDRIGGGAFDMVVQNYLAGCPEEEDPGPLERLHREWALSADIGTVLRRNLRRLRGLLVPNRGLPPGMA